MSLDVTLPSAPDAIPWWPPAGVLSVRFRFAMCVLHVRVGGLLQLSVNEAGRGCFGMGLANAREVAAGLTNRRLWVAARR